MRQRVTTYRNQSLSRVGHENQPSPFNSCKLRAFLWSLRTLKQVATKQLTNRSGENLARHKQIQNAFGIKLASIAWTLVAG